MAERSALTQASLEQLGPASLARALLDHAEQDAVLRRKLRLMLVGAASPARLAGEVAKRIDKMGRSRSSVDAEQSRALARELDDLRRAIADQVAPALPGEAAERLWQLLGIALPVQRRLDHGGDRIAAIFTAAIADLGRISAALPGRDPVALAARVTATLDANASEVFAQLVVQMSEALGSEGRAVIRAASLAALARLPPADGTPQWGVAAQRMEHVGRLLAVADLEQDVDAYVAAVRAGGAEALLVHDVAGRLLAAGRPEEALGWLDRQAGRLDDGRHLDLRLAVLDALGRTEAAQDLRWAFFERHLSHRHLRDYLKRLPDFTDFEAEQQGLALAMTHADAGAALDFLVHWPDLARAERLVAERLDQLDVRHRDLLRAAAAAFDARRPLPATQLRRLLVESVLSQGAADAYTDALVDLLDAAGSAARVEPGADLEPHRAFVDRLRSRFGRKYKFWNLYDETR